VAVEVEAVAGEVGEAAVQDLVGTVEVDRHLAVSQASTERQTSSLTISPAKHRSLDRLRHVTNRGRQIFTYRVDTEAGPRSLVSILENDWVLAHGLCAEAILGTMSDSASTDRLSPTGFHENPAFIRFLAQVISEGIDGVDGLRRQAETQRTGYVYLLDARTPDPSGRVPAEDIIGAVTVEDGAILAGSYRHNDRHKLFTGNGFFRLPDELENALDRHLRARSSGTA
jgi:hypothetical protein